MGCARYSLAHTGVSRQTTESVVDGGAVAANIVLLLGHFIFCVMFVLFLCAAL